MKHRVIVLAIVSLVWLAAVAVAQTKPDDAENGKRLFMINGCYQCHGTVGQGGAAGPRLAQIRLPLNGFIAFVRRPPPSSMPQYRAKVMSDQELSDVYAHIKTFPEPVSIKTIAILNE